MKGTRERKRERERKAGERGRTRVALLLAYAMHALQHTRWRRGSAGGG